MATYVTFDPENGDLSLTLPGDLQTHQDELFTQLAERFLDADIDKQALEAMNTYVEAWLREHA